MTIVVGRWLVFEQKISLSNQHIGHVKHVYGIGLMYRLYLEIMF